MVWASEVVRHRTFQRDVSPWQIDDNNDVRLDVAVHGEWPQ